MADYVLNKLWYRNNGVLKEVNLVNGKELNAIHYNGNNYIKAPPAPVPGELNWDSVIASISAGTYATDYHIGDLIPLNLGNQGTVDMQIVGFNVDEMDTTASQQAAITFISKQTLVTLHAMTDTQSNSNNWTNSSMRTYLSNTIFPLIPETVRNAIKAVRKESITVNDQNAVSTLVVSDSVWLPSAREVNAANEGTTPIETTGPVYLETFPNNDSRKKKNISTNADVVWALRSRRPNKAFYATGTSGGIKNLFTQSTYPLDVVLGFCLGDGQGSGFDLSISSAHQMIGFNCWFKFTLVFASGAPKDVVTGDGGGPLYDTSDIKVDGVVTSTSPDPAVFHDVKRIINIRLEGDANDEAFITLNGQQYMSETLPNVLAITQNSTLIISNTYD